MDPDGGRSQVAICSLRNNGTDPPRETIGPKGPIASRGRSLHVRSSVNYVDDKTNSQGPLLVFSGSAIELK